MNAHANDLRSVTANPAGEQSTLYVAPSLQAEVSLLARMLYREGYNTIIRGISPTSSPTGGS